MKLVIEQSALKKAVAQARTAVAGRNTIPILSNLLLRAENGRLDVSGTDLDRWMSAHAPAAVETEGATTVPAALLAQVVNTLPAGAEIAVAADGQGCTIAAGRRRASLPVLPAADFPDRLREDAELVEIDIGGAEFAAMLEACAPAMSTEETRYYLNGIHILSGADDGMLAAVATNGHQLIHAGSQAETAIPSVILPRTAIPQIVKGLEAGGRLAIDTAIARLTHDDFTFTTRLVDGTFPDLWRVIPQVSGRSVTVDASLLAAAANFVLATANNRAVKLTPGDGCLALSTRNADLGEASDEIAADCAPAGAHEPMAETGVNGTYLCDIVAALGAKEVVLDQSGPGAPMLIRPADFSSSEGAAARQAVLMPMRV